MNLTEVQKRYLRGLGHKLKPVVTVGGAGVSESLLKEFDSTIDHHELVKVRFHATDREQRDAMIDQLCNKGNAALVSRIGHTALLYRPNRDARKIQLPPG
ncbi:MAG TPA: ribosome assembly RNA-binding protein YhbY [Woeseiaceae bacterium]|nr:ribosome assembly RNA-binding protein YhbY [Woeseiaceae bacterium]